MGPAVELLEREMSEAFHDMRQRLQGLADDEFFTAENLLTLRNTRIANLLNLPAISLPTARPACGLMVMGATGRDRHLLRVAAAIEAALG